MFMHRFTKSVVGTAVVAGALGMATLLAGTASALPPANPTDAAFIDNVHKIGSSVDNPTQIIETGKNVCVQYDAGARHWDSVPTLLEENPTWSEDQAKGFIVLSLQMYCPDRDK